MALSARALWVPALVLCSSVVYFYAQREPKTHNGTTPNIDKVFIGRCREYNDKETRCNGSLRRVATSCDDLWDYFQQGFRYKAPCYDSMKGYMNFIKAGRQELPKNKVMFWSGVYQEAHNGSCEERKYITLEDTLVGNLTNGLTWCGQKKDPGISFDYCPEWGDCTMEASYSFWAAASEMYAELASGEVTLMLGGSNPHRPAYKKKSIFGEHELPNLSNRVTRVNILVTLIKGSPVMDVLHILCAEDPSVEECRLAKAHANGDLPYPTEEIYKHAGMNRMPVDHFTF